MAERLVVIGGVAAGMSAAAKAKRTRRDLEVVVYEKGGHISYAACGLPYFLAGDVPHIEELIVRTPEQMARQGVEVKVHHEVTSIDPGARTVWVHDLERDRAFEQPYDRLVIATGARPSCPPLPGCELGGIFGLRSLESGLAIQRYLREEKPKSAVIVGGGYIGVEMAETLRRLGLEVTILVRSGKVLRATLDDDMRELVHAELSRHGVEIAEGPAVGFEGDDDVESVQAVGEEYACDTVILGLGAEPNVGLARAAGVALGPTGAIATDDQMCTNLPGVYAAGDCAEALHLVTGRPAWVPLGSTANKQGRVAGSNAAGKPATFGGILGTMIVRCFDLAVGFTGLTSLEARAAGYDVQEFKIQASDLSHYFPGAAEAHVKLVVDGGSGRLLGGQLVGPHRAIKRIDVLATALYNRMTVPQIQELDLGYAPPFAPVWDPVLVAANVAAKD
ncbi:MAG: FAD-dependent oxidoreductase [Anaerolineae bacterium]|jgi:NADPH-dependent 2,4-dienoyl-CoA reductase/sulfur reductase-like enzyme|nr:FAD-dependent oxidoreductase [Anaerolineae bacterium]